MKNSLLKIGEMAELNHVSTQTLRLYARNKLLEPEYLDPETGYRYYTLEQCAKLDLIRALKSCRLSLEQIQEIFSLSSKERLLQALEEQTGVLTDEIYHLSVSRNNLSRVQKNLQILNTLPPFGQVFFEYVPERKIDVQKT
ncbi:MAG: MerR family transcriptional regulator, partial [Evtepia sp.]